ncbi:MAG TPA: CdaR family protein [Vicinamibacterales bacterium]|nr:CdaR family protein [Vicinamibacterales bacterium]
MKLYHPFRHLGLKVLAITLAALLWLTVAGEHVVERAIRVPLEIRNKPAQLEILGDPPAAVDVRLSGSSALLSRLEPGQVVVVVDLSGARPGSRLFHLRTEEVRAPYGITVEHVSPPTLSLDLEQASTRTVPIMPAVEGEPAPGYVIGQITSEPSTVQVVGPQSRVRELQEATTEPVSIEGRRERVRDVVTVGVADSTLRLVQPQSATVVVDVLPAPVERKVENVPIRWRNLGQGHRAKVAPSRAQVMIRGGQQVIESIRPADIDAFVDLAGLGAGRYNLRVQVDPPSAFGIGSVTPQVVEVVIR